MCSKSKTNLTILKPNLGALVIVVFEIKGIETDRQKNRQAWLCRLGC